VQVYFTVNVGRKFCDLEGVCLTSGPLIQLSLQTIEEVLMIQLSSVLQNKRHFFLKLVSFAYLACVCFN